MSTIGRLFVFVNLVLSIVFLTCGAFLLAKSDDFRGQLAKEKKERAADLAERQDRITKLEAEMNGAKNDAEKDRIKATQAETDAAQLKLRAEKAEAENGRLGTEVARIATVLENFRKNNEDLQATVDKNRKDLDGMRDERDGAKKKQEDAENALAQATDSSKSLESAKASLMEQVKSLEDKNTSAENALAIYSERTGIPLSDVKVAPPLINGNVTDVAADVKLIQLNVGADANMKKGYSVSIYRGNLYKGEAIIEDVQPKFSTARIVKVAPNRTIERGDNATTRLF